MTDDIVERLRRFYAGNPNNIILKIVQEAAAEIERLRTVSSRCETLDGCPTLAKAAAEIERLRSEARVYQDTMQWEQREKELQAEIERLRRGQSSPAFVPGAQAMTRDIVEQLRGYTERFELSPRIQGKLMLEAAAEIERLRADCWTVDNSGIEISHDELCTLSREFNVRANLADLHHYRINEWLKRQISRRALESKP